MKRPIQAMWAGAWLLSLLAGCSALDLTGFFALQNGANGGQDRVIAGSLEGAVQSTKASLEFLGLSAVVRQDAEAVRIASQTLSGARFTLVLTREKGKNGEQTRVRLEWEGGADEPAGLKILSQIEAGERGRPGRPVGPADLP